MRIFIFFIFSISLFVACNKDDNGNDAVQNESDEFSICNSMLSECFSGSGNYCLFGFKWGQTNPLLTSGFNSVGPRESGGILTFSFQEKNGLVNTHSQINLPSKSFNNLPSCAKTEIRNALTNWSLAADIEFEELPENSETDIKFFIADIRQSGIGYPNYPESPCSSLAGHVIIQSDLRITDCNALNIFLTHEIGHVLGLGHVNTNNIMNSDYSIFKNLNGLQSGDIQGITELYGEK